MFKKYDYIVVQAQRRAIRMISGMESLLCKMRLEEKACLA